MCKISIIIPVYNAERYIEKCLKSIINQTLTEIEVIIINDGSHDKSLEICENYANQDPRIRIIDKENQGVSIARNKGIEEAKGKYIMFIDADDWIENNACEILYSEIKQNSADLCFCNHIIEYNDRVKKVKFYDENSMILKDDIRRKIILPLIEENQNKIHEKASFRSPWGKLFKKSIIIDNNIRFNKELSIGEDFIFNLEYLSKSEKVVMSDNYLYHYLINDTSTLKRYKSNCWDLYRKLMVNLEYFLKNTMNEENYLNRLNRLKIKYLLICVRNELSPLNKKKNSEKIKYIKHMCNDNIVKLILKDYSHYTIGKKNKLLLFLLKYNIYLPFSIKLNLKVI